jgi:catechol 2,3-dioxygenase-like lactoylglutathione lyase family enzyme
LAFAIAAFGILMTVPATAQGLRLSAVGIGTKNYKESMDFYSKIMGFKPAFSFSPNGKTQNTYFQLSKDTFIELQESSATTPPGLTHIHMLTENVDGITAKLRKNGMPACAKGQKTACIEEPKMAAPTKEKNVSIYDPSGIHIEPTEFLPESSTRKAVNEWNGKTTESRLLVVGIGVKDYDASKNFYEKYMGFPIAFKFTSPDGKRTTTYYQINKDTFMEMQPVVEGAEPGLTHLHMETKNLDALIAQLKKNDLAGSARNATTPNTVTEAGITMPSNVKSANVFDPNGNRLELNELLPETLTKKAMDAWK